MVASRGTQTILPTPTIEFCTILNKPDSAIQTLFEDFNTEKDCLSRGWGMGTVRRPIFLYTLGKSDIAATVCYVSGLSAGYGICSFRIEPLSGEMKPAVPKLGQRDKFCVARSPVAMMMSCPLWHRWTHGHGRVDSDAERSDSRRASGFRAPQALKQSLLLGNSTDISGVWRSSISQTRRITIASIFSERGK